MGRRRDPYTSTVSGTERSALYQVGNGAELKYQLLMDPQGNLRCRTLTAVRKGGRVFWTNSGRVYKPKRARDGTYWIDSGPAPEVTKKVSGARKSVHTVSGGSPGLSKRK